MKTAKSGARKVGMTFIYIFSVALFGFILILTPGCQKAAENNLIRATGTVESRTARISPRVSGRVLQVLVEEGQAVEPGQLLLELDHEYLDLQLRQAEAAVAAARAQLELLRKGGPQRRHQPGRAAAQADRSKPGTGQE